MIEKAGFRDNERTDARRADAGAVRMPFPKLLPGLFHVPPIEGGDQLLRSSGIERRCCTSTPGAGNR